MWIAFTLLVLMICQHTNIQNASKHRCLGKRKKYYDPVFYYYFCFLNIYMAIHNTWNEATMMAETLLKWCVVY